jgi:hypothetical protein
VPKQNIEGCLEAGDGGLQLKSGKGSHVYILSAGKRNVRGMEPRNGSRETARASRSPYAAQEKSRQRSVLNENKEDPR